MAGGNKSRSRDAIAVRLAAGETVVQAAAAGGVSERTVYAWLAEDPKFKARVRELQVGIVTEATAVLRNGLTAAARTLIDLLDNDSAAIRLRAAVSLITVHVSVFEAGDLMRILEEQRVKLERLERERQQPGSP